jgi:hypothetical protein
VFDLLRSHAIGAGGELHLSATAAHPHIYLAHFMDLEQTEAWQRQFQNQLSSGIWLPRNSDKRSLARSHSIRSNPYARHGDLRRKVYWKKATLQ